ncbi:hypothetical protein M3204_03410 [Mesobacillus subterraneus]|uniref:hypothetical protein n=1 Tax=Mesobacillus subterraneus TaxID=285983 RepID=UPI002040FDCF|nr:hypothetical protein [Mesobacillus subterraneus]MCM3663438.1 hypothetical protein [Mesobacillus subterraneus]MCM3683208.1 hypothetical protein [Mesobacillus subterraneus]
MSLDALTAKINRYVEEMEFATARVYIEENIEILNNHKNMLNKNARELLDFLLELQAEGGQPLTKKDMAIINAINTYAHKFDVRGIKMLVKDNPNLLLRKDTPAYLNADAKIILQGMGAI